MKRFFRFIILSCFLLVNVFCANGQNLPALPMDSAVRYGQLENGLTYYIRHNETPKKRCEFHLVQAVGAILEEDHQNGLAHFLEHMAFNGTEHFAGKGIINYFETIGVEFGSNINAYTSLDETVYRLSNVPTYRKGIIDTALLVLHDWSCALSLLDEEIDAERGVIREEWRTRAQADRRMWKASSSQKYPNSQYAKRDIIGDTAVINNFPYSALRSYYKKWYRPDLQSVVVVGDVDVDVIEKNIKELWKDVPSAKNRGERPIYSIPDNKEPIVSFVTDKEATFTRIDLEYKQNPLSPSLKLSQVGFVQDVVNAIVSLVLSDRFAELSRKPDAAFVFAVGGYGELVKSKDVFQLSCIAKEGKEHKALEDLFIEAERLKRFGITNSELQRAKSNIFSALEREYNEREKRDNILYVNRCIDHFLNNYPLLDVEWKLETIKRELPRLSLEMVNTFVKNKCVREDNLIISFSAPEKENVVLPTQEEVLLTLAKVNRLIIDAPQEENLNRVLVESKAKMGSIKELSRNATLDATEWTLSNGIKVIIKPTTFKKDEILMLAYSKGGTSKVEKIEDLPSAFVAEDLVDFCGLGDFSASELEKMLAGKMVGVSPSINSLSEELQGSSSIKDFETMLQLVYLHFTAPRKDDDAFGAMTDSYRTAIINRSKNPKTHFGDSIALTRGAHHPRMIILDEEFVKKLNMKKSLEIYQQRFANAADFTFMFVGNIDPNDKNIKEKILYWLGGLKTKKTRENFVDHNIRFPNGKVENHFSCQMETKTASNFVEYNGSMDFSLANLLNLKAVASILDIRYLESIREREGGSYGVGVSATLTKEPTNKATLSIQFDTDPEKQEPILAIVYQEISEIVENGPRSEDLQKVKEIMLKNFAENLEENEWWLSALYNNYFNGFNLVDEYKKAVKGINGTTIQTALKNLVQQGNVIEVTMLPE